MGKIVKSFNTCCHSFSAPETLPRRLCHCMLLHFPDQGNSPGDLFLDGLVGRRETSRILRRFWSPRGPSPARQPPRPKHALNRQGRMVLSCFLSVNERTDVAMATTKMALMMSMATRRRQPPREDTQTRARPEMSHLKTPPRPEGSHFLRCPASQTTDGV